MSSAGKRNAWEGAVSDLSHLKIAQSIKDRKALHLKFLKAMEYFKAQHHVTS